MLRQITFATLWSLTVLFTPFQLIQKANAESTDSEDKGKVVLESLQKFKPWRLAIAKGFIDFSQKIKQVDFNLEWELLADDYLEDTIARREFIIPETIIIPNEDLGDPDKWNKHIKSPKAREMLQRALCVDDLSKWQLGESLQNFNKFWLFNENSNEILPCGKTGRGNRLVRKEKNLSAANYYGLGRDYTVISSLLASKGIEIYFRVPEENVLGKSNWISSENDDVDIKWKIKIYEFKTGDVYYYRYTAQAIVEDFRLRFRAEETKSTLQFSIKSQEDSDVVLLPYALLTKDLEINPANIGDDLLPEELGLGEQEINATNQQLDATLGFVGNQVSGLVTGGLLAGTEDADIIGGALVDFDDSEIEPLLGANLNLLDLGSVGSGGLLFGIEPSDDVSLFLGPSLQFSIFTLSPGFRLTGDDDLESSFAGVFSLDLSSLIGQKPEVKTLEIDDSQNETGTEWDRIHYVYNQYLEDNLTILYLTLNTENLGGKLPEEAFCLRRIKDKNERDIPPISQEIPELIKSDGEIYFIPQGTYEYIVHQGYLLTDQTGNPVPVSTRFIGDKLHSLNLRLQLVSGGEDEFFKMRCTQGSENTNTHSTEN